MSGDIVWWERCFRCSPGRRLGKSGPGVSAPRVGVKAYRPRSQRWVAAMGLSEFDRINASLDRAEFAIDELRKKLDGLHRKATLTKTPEEMVALKLEVAELLQRLRTVRDGVHRGNPAPHLRLVSNVK